MIGWHRRLALIAAIAVLLWGSSGLLHPLMSWTNPRPASFMPPAQTSASGDEDLLVMLRQQNIKQVKGVRVIGRQMQVTLPGQPERLYIDLDIGEAVAGGDRARALMLARHYTGLSEAEIISARLITSFSNRYTYINRYLPVWQIDFADPRHMTAYVDTATDRLGAITDKRKIILQTLFQIMHTGQWLEEAELLRLALLTLLIGAALLMAVAGFYMLVRLRGRRTGLRKIHRGLAYAALFPLLMFPVSGLFHLFVHSPLLYGAHDQSPVIVDVASLQYAPRLESSDIRLVIAGNKVWWRSQTGDEVVYLEARSQAVLHGDEAFVRDMVGDRAGVPITSVSKITAFSDEYGFANKRLPVWRVDTGSELWFIEARTGVVAARIDRLKIAESWSFSRLHKWQFLDRLSEKIMGDGPLRLALRDGVMVVFMLGGLVLAVLGLLIRRKYKN